MQISGSLIAIAGFAGAIFASIIANIIFAWFKTRNHAYDVDALSIIMIERALNLLPKAERERYGEEWVMAIYDHEKATDRLKHAFSLIFAAITISGEVRAYAVASSVGLISTRIISATKKNLFGSGFKIAIKHSMFNLHFYYFIFSLIEKLMLPTYKPTTFRAWLLINFAIVLLITFCLNIYMWYSTR